MSKLGQKILTFFRDSNTFGVPIPLIRDPKTKRGDVALTLVVISAIFVIVGLVGKWNKKLEGVDIQMALNWFYGCSALYWARKLSSDSSGDIVVDNGNTTNVQPTPTPIPQPPPSQN